MRVRRTDSSSRQLPNGLSRGCGTVFFGIFAAVGLLMTAILVVGLFGTLRTYLWEETPCTIVESHRVEPGVEKARGSDGEFVIRYRYMAKGRERTSNVFTNGVVSESRDQSDIERLLLDYRVDSNARCYVNPRNPEEAILRRGPLWIFAFIAIPLIFVAVGVGGIVRLWTFGKPTADSIARRAMRAGANSAGVLFGSIFALVGAGLVYGLTIHPAQKVAAARSWEEVPCHILRSDVGKHRGSKSGTTYSVEITYAYSVKGREFRSNRYEFMGGSSSGYEGKAAVVNRYPPGTEAVCYVNPADPTDAVLDRGFHATMLFGLLGLIFLLVGLGVLFGTRRAMRPKLAASRGLPDIPAIPQADTKSLLGAMELESASTPVGRFLGAVFIAVFWNGITGVFVGMAIKSWLTKKPEIFLSILITPFVLVGLGLIAFVFHSLLNLLNPRIRLTVSAGSVPLGGKLDARWTFRGRSSRIRQLRITLEGTEKARYSRGTDNRTDTHVFARLPVVDTTDARQIAEGQAQLLVPADSMHTFSASHNEIVWALKVHGDVPRFPDVSDEFPMTILPRG